MSELTRCNRCTLLDIRRRNSGARIELRMESDIYWDRQWIAVCVDGERVVSFLELTEKCVC